MAAERRGGEQMGAHRVTRAKLHASAIVTLAALQLVLSTSSTVILPAAAPEGPAPVPSVLAETAEARAALTPLTTADPVATVPTARRTSVVDVRAGDIPWVALQGYKRAADILGEVDESCGISWTLLAAVGQVGSRHGQVADSQLGDDAVARPALVAPAATRASVRVADTDAGEIDGDADEDRAVGPMQLQPAIWSVAGVDGDGDGHRSPQDIDDAALATAVFLCATGKRLDESDGAAEALRGLNHSRVYVDQVLAVAAEYDRGDFAVADPPALQTIGTMLGTGPSAPALAESARAVKRIEKAGPDGRGHSTRTPTTRARKDTAPARTRAPAAAPPDDPAAPGPSEPSESPAPGEDPAAEAPGTEEPAAHEPAAQEPAEDPSAEPAEEPSAEEPVEEPSEQPTSEPPAEDPPAEDPPAEDAPSADPPSEQPSGQPTDPPSDPPGDPPGEQPGEQPTVEVEGTWTTCETGYCLEVTSGETGETGEPVLLMLDLELLGKTDEELAAMVGQVFTLVVVEGTEPMVVVEIVPPETE